jgi:hypothetical protein
MAFSAGPSSKTIASPIIVDFVKGTVGVVRLRDEGESLLKKLRADRVKKEVEYPEGDPTDVYIVTFGSHKVYRHWNAFSFTDPVFRTKDGLGVGSTIKDFEKVYGKAELKESEGGAGFEFSSPDLQFFVLLNESDVELVNSTSYGRASAKEIWVW